MKRSRLFSWSQGRGHSFGTFPALEQSRRFILSGGAIIALLASADVSSCRAQDTNAAITGSSPSSCPVVDYFANWFDRVNKTQAEQPHWAPPIGITTPRLMQAFRFDYTEQSLKGGHTLQNYGSGKGLEFIPAERIQFIVGIPPWETQDTTPRKEGWGDQSFLMKYRIAAANEEEGNYIVTAFMGLTVPNGSDDYSMHHFTFTPTLAAGKGWGDFNIQGTVGMTFPDNGAVSTGMGTPLAASSVFQYHIAKYFWPEVEANYTWWPNGVHEGLNQLFISPGLILGKFPIWQRLGIMFGAGLQIAVTEHPLSNRNLVVSGRIVF
jgi:hypothetical protein